MKTGGFIIFLSVVLVVFVSVNYYLFTRGLQALQALQYIKWVRPAYYFAFIFLASSYIIYRVLERVALSPVSTFFGWVGSIWMAVMIYLLLIVVLLDMTRLLNRWFDFFPDITTANYIKAKFITGAVSFAIVLVIVIVGFINNLLPSVTRLDIKIGKKAGDLKALTIVAVTDVHLGSTISRYKISKMVSMINELKPDIVLFGGDLLDEDPAPVIRYNIGEPLKKIKAAIGVYAIPGNHEYIGGYTEASAYIKSLGITWICDSVLKIGNSFYLAGRDDKDIGRFSGRKRKTLPELLSGTDPSAPIILLDHQPFRLDETEKAGVDLQISGHTHNGQLWPLNFFTGVIFELSYGYKQKGNAHIYVSSGYGLWGPPVRTANRPETVCVKVKFKE